MPLTIYGDNTAKIILPHEANAEKPRTLRAKFLSKREIRSWQKRVAAAMEIADVDARDAEYDKLLGEVIVGWDNIPGEFSIAGISDHYTLSEVVDLLTLIPAAMVPGPDDLTKSPPRA